MRTRTIVTFLGERSTQRSEADASVWIVNRYLRINPQLFTDPRTAFFRKTAEGHDLFAPTPHSMYQPKRLANGWWMQTCSNHDQKLTLLDQIGRWLGLKRGRDWNWQSENMPTKKFIDVEAELAELDKL